MKKRLLSLILALLLALTLPVMAEGETVTETQTLSDGSIMTTVTDGSSGRVTTTIQREDGTLFQFITNQRGKLLDVLIDVSVKAARNSSQTGEAIEVPLRSMVKTPDEQNLRFRVELPFGVKGVWLAFPLEDSPAGAVAVTVDDNDKQTVIPYSCLWEDCLMFPLEADATVMLVDNSRSFADVHKVGHKAQEAVDFVVARELFRGVDDTHFAPEATLTRAMVVTVLWRLVGSPKVDHAMTFLDVRPDAYYMDAVGWAFAQKLVSGYNETTFAPNDIISREQLATILWRFAEAPAVFGAQLDFDDAGQVSEYAVPALKWATGEDIFPTVRGDLQPKEPATRAQTAQLLMNFLCR